jgi:lipid-binding SYLF domain-containing protein
MTKTSKLAGPLALIAALPALPLRADTKLDERVRDSREVYAQLIQAPDQGVPKKLRDDCRCIVVIPRVIKAALGFGGRHGKGIASCKNDQGAWSPPAFLSLSGGSFGLQIGGESTDLVLFLMSQKGARSLLKSEFTLGADASVAAGPVGRTASASTDIRLDAEIYAYARAKGLFAGIALEGASLNPDEDAVEYFYGADIPPETILFQQQVPKVPESAKAFMQALP